MNPYETLGVPPDATTESIRAAYRSLSKLHHPDKNEGRESQQWHDINNAHQVLTDPNQRQQYDQTGLMPGEDSELLNAINLIQALFGECMNENQSPDANILASIRAKLRNKQAALEMQVQNIEANIRRWKLVKERIEARWKPKNKGTRIKRAMGLMLEHSIMAADAQKTPLESQLRICRVATEQIDDDEYEMPTLPASQPATIVYTTGWGQPW